ncbi:hypothetical protein K2P97_09980 [bacterium]|nr:hypothetical protein [bacterium]
MQNKVVLSILVVAGILASQLSLAQASEWRIKKTEWSDADEKAYSEFVSLIGQAVEKRECDSFQSCLMHKNNPYRSSDSNQLNVFADCAKLSFVMRAYFAWKNELPFSVSNGIKLRGITGNAGDLRYSNFGNEVVSRLDFLPVKTPAGIKFVNPITTLNKTIINSVYSASFRYHYEVNDDSNVFTDFYPVTLDRNSIRPGTNIYDPNGHVAIVYKVTEDGKIYFIDAHPDNSLTSGLYGTKFVRSNPGQGAGFKNFRPLKLVGAIYDQAARTYVGGKILGAKNSEIKDYDLVQFFGTERKARADWSKGPFMIDGQSYGYYDYLRMKLSTGNLKINPLNEIKSLAEDLCQTSQDRVVAVAGAAKSGVDLKSHPDRLPVNIYGTSGEWEEYSTPSRDARLKTSFKELRDLAESLNKMNEARDPRLDYSGENIKRDMLAVYWSASMACKIDYTKSNGEIKSLNLEDVRQRLFGLSFDPYHCAELRWGATSAEELATCPVDENKLAWYRAEVWLRNQIERRYDARMDFSLSELDGPKPGVGVANPPDVDIIRYLQSN